MWLFRPFEKTVEHEFSCACFTLANAGHPGVHNLMPEAHNERQPVHSQKQSNYAPSSW